MEIRKRFRELIDAPEILVLPGAFDSLSAKLVEAAGFPAGFMTGYGHSASKLGEPDVGLMTLSEMADRARDTISAVNIPFAIDGDTGFGNSVNVVRTIREYERAGAAAIQLEDQTMPKKCGHMLGREVVPAEEMAGKIRAAVAARTDPDFLIIARTDARTVYGVEEAVRRAHLYEEAGADMIFVESLESVDEMKLINREITSPTLANMVEGGRSPYLSAAELQEIGYNAVYYPVALLYSAAKAVLEVLEQIKSTGCAKDYSIQGGMLSFQEFNRIIGLDEIRRIEANDFSAIRKKLQ